MPFVELTLVFVRHIIVASIAEFLLPPKILLFAEATIIRTGLEPLTKAVILEKAEPQASEAALELAVMYPNIVQSLIVVVQIATAVAAALAHTFAALDSPC